MEHAFADLLGIVTEEVRPGYSRLSLAVLPAHFNPHEVLHGAVAFALADTGMGAALYPTLEPDEACATIEIKINYFRAVTSGTLVCITEMANRGRTVANLESQVFCGDTLVAKANGNYAIFKRRP